MFSSEPKLYPKFISESERVILKNYALLLLQTGVLRANSLGPNRFFKTYRSLDELEEHHKLIYERVVNTLQIKNPIIDPHLGIIISVIKPGGFIHRHKDIYKWNIHTNPALQAFIHHKNFRFNIMVQRDDHPSYSPHINNNRFDVEECDSWFFDASTFEHETPIIEGDKYRIVYQFGFAIK